VIEASYTLSTLEQRLILSAIAQVPIKENVLDSVMYPISLEAVAKLSGNEGIRLEHLKDAMNRLYDRSIVLRDTDESTSFRWIQQKTETKSGELYIRFSAPILPFLSNLNESFTKYLESDIVGMTSPYAIRFYELMMQYRSVGKREISLEDLRWMFQLQDKYPVWADLKRWVIDQAVKEINQYSPYKLTVEPKKTGRKITSIALKFQDKKALKAPKGKASDSNYGQIPATSTPPKGMSGIGSITNAMVQKNTNTLAHRISRITQAIQANPELQKRFKRPDENIIQMSKRLREDNTTDHHADMLEAKLEEFGIVFP
jgi:plasmid replication initiation protein